VKFAFRLLLLLLVTVSFAHVVHAQCAGGGTCTLPNCNQSTLQNALNSINTDGTVVVLPTCSVTWTNNTSVQYNQTNSYTLQGQTVVNCTGTPGTSGYNCAATDNTNIAFGFTTDTPLITLGVSSGKTLRVTGITISQGAGATITYNGAFDFYQNTYPQTVALRVDHVHIAQVNRYPVSIYGNVEGVWDHDLLEGYDGSVWRTFGGGTWQSQAGSFGDPEWAAPTNLGSGQYMYFEADVINNGSNDCTQGGRWVIRYSTFNAGSTQSNQVLNHPTGGGGRDRGCRAWEVYNNYFNYTGTGLYNVYYNWSGTGVVWGNTAKAGAFTNFMTIISTRRNNSTYSQAATPSGWGYCGTSQDGTGSNWDQNSNTTTGYRCLDQVGQGQGQLLENDFPSAINTVTSTISWPNEALEPMYEWMDVWSGNTFIVNQDSDVLVQNSDYYISSDPGTSNCTGFTGATGVGCGLGASRPSACTAGVAYWATDANSGVGELYKCTATGNPGTWTGIYEPYTYPHPLVGGGAVTLSPSTQNFGSVTVSSSSSPVTFTLQNNSSSSATSVSISNVGGNSSDFAISSNTCTSTLAASASCTLLETFTPSATGARSTTLTVTYSGGDGASPQTSALSGTGSSSAVGTSAVGLVTVRGGVTIK
jgi:Abnormal spindle-like microcephaly-assoc'd, ASPM-SPD-2-Hydin